MDAQGPPPSPSMASTVHAIFDVESLRNYFASLFKTGLVSTYSFFDAQSWLNRMWRSNWIYCKKCWFYAREIQTKSESEMIHKYIFEYVLSCGALIKTRYHVSLQSGCTFVQPQNTQRRRSACQSTPGFARSYFMLANMLVNLILICEKTGLLVSQLFMHDSKRTCAG